MTVSQSALAMLGARRDQMFPTMTHADIDRLHRFGESKFYETGDLIVRAGQCAPGLIDIPSGKEEVTQGCGPEQRETLVTHLPGQFAGELAQLSARPSLVDADALEPVQALVVRSDRLRDLLVQEAELGERIMRALILRRVGLLESGASGPVIIGHANHADVLRLQGFLTRNGQPHRVLDSDNDPCASILIERFHLNEHHLPIVLCPNGKLLRNPSEIELARCIGLVRPIDATKVYDVAIVGAGPAGLATSVYAASEGLSVIVLDCRAFGGQAGASARIENYLGFPTGISGMALMGRAYSQAQKFGAEMAIPDEATSLLGQAVSDGGRFLLTLANNERASARSIVIASGARYRRPAVPRLTEFEGRGVSYWASAYEAKTCAHTEVVLVGGGNSAGQAAVFLAPQATKVFVLIRGPNLASSMSRYLIDRVDATPNIELRPHTELTQLYGHRKEGLNAVSWRDKQTGLEEKRPIRHVFVFVGADPETKWLAGCGVALDPHGFVLTGQTEGLAAGHVPAPLESSVRGVFAIGDVRSGSVKRVGGAIGEGAAAVALIHQHLAADGAVPTLKGEKPVGDVS